MNNSFPLARQHPHRRFGTLRCWKSLLALYVWPVVCWKGVCLSICSGCPCCAKGFPLFTTVKRTQNGSNSSKNVQKGSKRLKRVQKGSKGFKRVQKGSKGLKKGSKGFKRAQKGFKRVQNIAKTMTNQ